VDELPKGSKLYTFTDEVRPKLLSTTSIAYSKYPKNSGFNLKLYSKLMLDNISQPARLFDMENILEGISGEAVYKFKLNLGSQEGVMTHCELYNKVKELHQEKYINHATLLTYLQFETLFRKENIKANLPGINPEWYFNIFFNQLAYLLDNKVEYKPSKDKPLYNSGSKDFDIRSSELSKIFDSDALETKILSGQEINILDILGKKDSFLNDNQSQLPREKDLFEIIEDLSTLNDYKPGARLNYKTANLNLSAGITSDHSEKHFMTIMLESRQKLVGSDIAESNNIVNIELTEKEVEDFLLKGDFTGVFDFLLTKSYRALDKHPISQYLSADKLNDIKTSLENENIGKIIARKVAGVFKELYEYNQLTLLDIQDDYEFLIKSSEYNANKIDKTFQPITILEKPSNSEKYIKYIPEEQLIVSYDQENQQYEEFKVEDGKIIEAKEESQNIQHVSAEISDLGNQTAEYGSAEIAANNMPCLGDDNSYNHEQAPTDSGE
jgi:hypothetical protein